MSILAILVLGVVGAAAVATVAIHLIAVRQPPPLDFPTARFVPSSNVLIVARGRRPSDRLLLALRLAALISIGAAFSGYSCSQRPFSRLMIVVADSSQRADSATWWSAATSLDEAADGVVDSSIVTAHRVIWTDGLKIDPGVAIVRAIAEAGRVVREESNIGELSLSVVMPSMAGSLRGWEAWESEWPARIRLTRVASLAGVDSSSAGEISGNLAGSAGARVAINVRSRISDDVVRAALMENADGTTVAMEATGATNKEDAIDASSAKSTVLVLRDGEGGASAADSMDAIRTDRSRSSNLVVVLWPDHGAPPGWIEQQPDTIGAVAAMGRALVGQFVRRYRWRGDDSVSQPIIWWADGTPAAVERQTESGCRRNVYLPVRQSDDLLLSSAASGVLSAIVAPCGMAVASTDVLERQNAAPNAAPDVLLRSAWVTTDYFREASARSEARSSTAAMPRSNPRWLAPFLLALALILLLVEQWLRARQHRSVADYS